MILIDYNRFKFFKENELQSIVWSQKEVKSIINRGNSMLAKHNILFLHHVVNKT